jgi:hypothetical protein
MDKIAVGGQCERLWGEAARDNARDSAGLVELQKSWKRAQDVPVHERTRIGKLWHEEQSDDVEGTLAEHGRERLVTVPVKRPKGLRQNIKERVAAEETSRRGITITPRMVDECWKEFRALQKRLDNDDV